MDFDELFGKGANEQETADPAPDAGAKEQETADPANNQSAEDNARFAAARRSAEAERDAVIAELGLTDENGKPILNKADYDRYKAAKDQKTKKETARKLGTTEEELDKIINDSPQMRDARAREDRHAKEETERKLNEELAQIAKLDPGIKSLDDLAKTEHFDEIVAKVQRGYSLTDAYTLANLGKLNAAGRQKALNAAGKDHLRALGGDTGGAPVTVPKAVLDSYHMMLPNMSDEDIAKDYAKRMKGR